MKQRYALLFPFLTVFLLLLNCSGTNDEVTTGTRSASVYNPDGKTPAVGATVKIFKADVEDGEYISLQTTDGKGRYRIDNIPPGLYNIWTEKDSLVSFRNEVTISDDMLIHSDTLSCPSTVCGIIAVQPQDDPLTVTIQVVGLDKQFNNTDENGRFTMTGMARGTYTLRLESTAPGYTPTAATITVDACTEDTINDTLHLIYTGIPIVRGVEVSYDTTSGIVNLHWDPTGYRHFQEYLIFRDFSDSAVYSTDPIAATIDTVFPDTIFDRTAKSGPFSFADTNDYHYRYRVAIRSNVNETGQTWRYTEVIAVSPRKVMTEITMSYRHIGKGYLTITPDAHMAFGNTTITTSASISDSLMVGVSSLNRSYVLTSAVWTDANGDTLRTCAPATPANTLDDTLRFFCNNADTTALTVTVTDIKGNMTARAIRIAVVKDLPTVTLSANGSEENRQLYFTVNDTLALHAATYDHYGFITAIQWHFGTLPGSITESPVYDTSIVLPDTLCSDYAIIVTVTDDDGNTASDSLHVKVDAFAPVIDDAPFDARMYHSVIVFNDTIRLYGGVGTRPDMPAGGFSNYDDVWFSADGMEWTEVQSDIPARAGQAMTVFDDKLWLIGGYNSWGEYENDVWNSTDGTTWKCVSDSAPFPPRIFHSIVTFNDRMWVIAGLTRKGKAGDIWSSDDGLKWEQATDTTPFSPRSAHACTVFDEKIWLIGGEDSSYSPRNDIWYSSDGAEWKQVADHADFSPRQGHSLLVCDNRLWLIEGYGSNAFNMAKDILNSTNGLNWTTAAGYGSITPRAFHSSVVFGNRIWIIAGMTKYDTCVNDVWHSGVPDDD